MSAPALACSAVYVLIGVLTLALAAWYRLRITARVTVNPAFSKARTPVRRGWTALAASGHVNHDSELIGDTELRDPEAAERFLAGHPDPELP